MSEQFIEKEVEMNNKGNRMREIQSKHLIKHISTELCY